MKVTNAEYLNKNEVAINVLLDDGTKLKGVLEVE